MPRDDLRTRRSPCMTSRDGLAQLELRDIRSVRSRGRSRRPAQATFVLAPAGPASRRRRAADRRERLLGRQERSGDGTGLSEPPRILPHGDVSRCRNLSSDHLDAADLRTAIGRRPSRGEACNRRRRARWVSWLEDKDQRERAKRAGSTSYCQPTPSPTRPSVLAALPMAGATHTIGVSPAPADGRSFRSSSTMSIGGMSLNRGTRYCSSVPFTIFGHRELDRLEQRAAEALDDAPSTWCCRPSGLTMAPHSKR